MSALPSLSSLIDARSFPSLWYWLTLAAVWSWVGRGALGIPSEVVRQARRDPQAATLLLDWISLVAPRWSVGQADGIVLAALGSFVVTVLGVSGIVYGGQFAQALLLLCAPLMLLGALRVRLAAGLARDLARASAGAVPATDAARLAAGRIRRHMLATRALSASAVLLAALVGARWMVRHPFGL